MSEIAKQIDRVVQADLAARLKVAGFRKSGRTFFRAQPDHTRVVNVQASLWNQGGEGSFAINLGIYFPAIADLSGGPVATGKYPKEYECTVRERLGALVYGGRDHWWPIAPGADLARLATSVGTAWSVFGRPWLDQMSTLRGAYDLVCSQKLYFLAANFALALGEREAAEQLLRQALTRAPRARARFEDWGHRHGLLP
jgi:Domain of unknown function (DUF4304)